MMRRVAVDDIDAAAVDEAVREADVGGGHRVTPVASPVNRGDRDVARTFHAPHTLSDIISCRLGEVAEEIYAGSRFGGGPVCRNATRLRTEREDDDPATVRPSDDRGPPRLSEISPGAGGLHPGGG